VPPAACAAKLDVARRTAPDEVVDSGRRGSGRVRRRGIQDLRSQRRRRPLRPLAASRAPGRVRRPGAAGPVGRGSSGMASLILCEERRPGCRRGQRRPQRAAAVLRRRRRPGPRAGGGGRRRPRWRSQRRQHPERPMTCTRSSAASGRGCAAGGSADQTTIRPTALSTRSQPGAW
jgi:hypothetical protein